MTTLIDVGRVFVEEIYPDTLAHHGVKGMKWGQHVAAGKGAQAQAKPAGKSSHLLSRKERVQFNKNHPNVKKGYLTNAQRALFYKNHPKAVVGKKIAPGAGKPGSHAESGGAKKGHTLGSGHKLTPGGSSGHHKSLPRPKSLGGRTPPGHTPKGGGSSAAPHVHPDSHKATQLKATVDQHGTKALGNDDLKILVDRMRLLQQHQQLTSQAASAAPKTVGQNLANEGKNLVVDQGRQQARQLLTKGTNAAANLAVQAAIDQVLKRRSH